MYDTAWGSSLFGFMGKHSHTEEILLMITDWNMIFVKRISRVHLMAIQRGLEN